MIETASDLFGALVVVGVGVAILWLGLQRSWRRRHRGWSVGSKIGLLAWLAALAFAFYLILIF